MFDVGRSYIFETELIEDMLAAIRKLSEKSPEIRELLNNFGLL